MIGSWLTVSLGSSFLADSQAILSEMGTHGKVSLSELVKRDIGISKFNWTGKHHCSVDPF